MRHLFSKRRLAAWVGFSAALVLVATPVLAGGFRTFLFAFPPAEVAWEKGTGVPEPRGPQQGLFMANPGSMGLAGAGIDGAAGITLTELGFDYRNGETCTAGSPRYHVRTEPNGDLYRFGCAGGIHTPAPDDMVNWTRVRFTDLDAVLIEGTTPWPGFGDVTVRRLSILFGSRTDEPGNTGQVHLDNLDVNTVLIRKPGNNN